MIDRSVKKPPVDNDLFEFESLDLGAKNENRTTRYIQKKP